MKKLLLAVLIAFGMSASAQSGVTSWKRDYVNDVAIVMSSNNSNTFMCIGNVNGGVATMLITNSFVRIGDDVSLSFYKGGSLVSRYRENVFYKDGQNNVFSLNMASESWGSKFRACDYVVISVNGNDYEFTLSGSSSAYSFVQ